MLVLSFAPFLQEKVVMARFNNLSELKQEVRLHIIQMETSLSNNIKQSIIYYTTIKQ